MENRDIIWRDLPIKGINVSNLSVIEHPHGGLIASFCYTTKLESVKVKVNNIGICYYNEKSHSWSEFLPIFTKNETFEELSHILFLDLKGTLQLMYNNRGMLQKRESFNYGKTWSEIKLINTPYKIENCSWQFINKPIFLSSGRILVPVYDNKIGRSMALIGEDHGNNWFPSTFIEVPEDIGPSEILNSYYNSEDVFRFKTKYPVFIHQSEKFITAFLQTENLKHIHRSDSYSSGEIWSETEPTNLPSNSTSINAVRLKDISGNFTPDVLLAYLNSEKSEITLNIALSENNGKSWSCVKVIETERKVEPKVEPKAENENKGKNENENDQFTKINYPSIVQSSDLKIHLIFSKNNKSIRHAEFSMKFFKK
ncbi:MAG: exo-alpha-sialidase [Promethearchaeota archaeon]